MRASVVLTGWDKLDAEREALKSLMDLYDQAKKSQQLHEAAGMSLPEPIKRFLGINYQATGSSPAKEAASVSPPSYHAPQGASENWFSIQASEATVSSVALAILRQSGVMRPRDLNEAVLDILPSATAGSVANMGVRLQGKVIDRAEDGWKLVDNSMAGIINNGRLWGPITIFSTQDIAEHRRESILHILKGYSTGLQTVQIVDQLRKCSWVHAPVNKDLLKVDMEVLQAKSKVRRRGNSKKWEIVREDS
jgi:hypothetical protein